VKRFADLSEQEVLALAISNEDEDNRIYRSFADALRGSYPDTAQMYDKMAEEEISHRDMLLDLHRKTFGEFLPLIRRQDVKGFVTRRPIWLNRPLALDTVRKFAEEMEYETARFYRRAAHVAHDEATRDLLDSHPLHGYAVPAGSLPSRGWRRPGVHGRHCHWQFMTRPSATRRHNRLLPV